MKGFMKRIIWFFGITLLDLLGDLIKIMSNNEWGYTILNITSPVTIIGLILITVIPLFFMKDDKEVGKK